MRAQRYETVSLDVGGRIAELRNHAGLTPARFAEQAGVSLRYFQSVEAGEQNLTLKTLIKFANLLGVRVADLFAAPKPRSVRRGRPRRRQP